MSKPTVVPASGSNVTAMPDPASTASTEHAGKLNWVGMSRIRQPLAIRDNGQAHHVQSQVQVYVDLDDADAKGIHMSRLYLILDEHADTRPLSLAGFKLMLSSLLQSHRDLSTQAFIELDFDYYLRRPALLSEYSGWNSYPVTIRGTLKEGRVHIELAVGVFYSSTCPCSAALARQLIQEQFDRDFGGSAAADVGAVRDWLGSDEGIVATPHSQRSIAKIKLELDDRMEDFPITHVIDLVEQTLKTPVQTAVKREDEQEFARLNGQNLMFVEDSSRKIKSALDSDSRFRDFWVRVEHHESLHAHDAVSIFTKGVDGGYQPAP